MEARHRRPTEPVEGSPGAGNPFGKRIYDEAARGALAVLWEASDRTGQRGLVANRVPRDA